MLNAFFLLLPSFISLVIFVILVVQNYKASRIHRTLTWLLFCGALYYYADAEFINSSSDYRAMIYVDVVSKFASLSMPVIIVIFLRAILEKPKRPILTTGLFAPTLIMGFIAIVIYSFIGIDNAAGFLQARDAAGGDFPDTYTDTIYKAQHVLCTHTYLWIMIIEMLLACAYIIFVWIKTNFKPKDVAAYFRKKDSNPAATVGLLIIVMLVISSFRIIIGRHYWLAHPVLTAAVSAFSGAYIGFISWAFIRRFEIVTAFHHES